MRELESLLPGRVHRVEYRRIAMKSSFGFQPGRVVVGLGLGIFVCTFASFSWAQITVNFDENGNGTFGGSPMPFHVNFLRYQFPINITVGDVVVTEGPVGPNGSGNSDILRFDDNGGVTVFSDLEAGEVNPDLADVPPSGFPMPAPGALMFPETDPSGGPAVEGAVNGLFGYAPLPTQPGGNPSGPQLVYNFTSDSVPEPGSITLLGFGAGTLLIRRRRAFVTRKRPVCVAAGT
jgi:hypothetical protein